MIPAAVDLHIHSALSPCGDSDMTPYNIVQMSILNGLNIIAVTDHNSALNVRSTMQAAHGTGLVVLPGIEVTTKEEAHILTYFKTADAAEEMGQFLFEHLPHISNMPDFYGPQLIYSDDDEITGCVDRLLISACDVSVDELALEAARLGGVIVPAHVDRTSYSLPVSLGFIPPELPAACIEISSKGDPSDAEKRYMRFKRYRVLRSSDAHYLEDISERSFFLNLEDLSRASILALLARPLAENERVYPSAESGE